MNRSRTSAELSWHTKHAFICSVSWHECKKRAWMGNIWKGVNWGHQCTVDQSWTILLGKKKSCKTLFPFHSVSHILLFTGAFCNLHHYVLGLAENERRAWGSRFQLVCHIQASFLNRSFAKFLDLTVPLLYLGNGFPVPVYLLQIQVWEHSCPCCLLKLYLCEPRAASFQLK